MTIRKTTIAGPDGKDAELYLKKLENGTYERLERYSDGSMRRATQGHVSDGDWQAMTTVKAEDYPEAAPPATVGHPVDPVIPQDTTPASAPHIETPVVIDQQAVSKASKHK